MTISWPRTIHAALVAPLAAPAALGILVGIAELTDLLSGRGQNMNWIVLIVFAFAEFVAAAIAYASMFTVGLATHVLLSSLERTDLHWYLISAIPASIVALVAITFVRSGTLSASGAPILGVAFGLPVSGLFWWLYYRQAPRRP
jgi:hypothetical protein